ncbi:DMT family transporter [Fusibacter ferrireducens]|uniref:Multidrug efflux SMR transporter n=1 Tax=Fusibacter ferrireducens TaxID=2785058 RepID=A0ABR9ZQ98_9FIRM|nr:multidrug efflux SMR transporter [Fusibacter ferrireducens]MBF4692313.1 multidrug efflux SMR transporter [Fusibacter ferrireducens]
MHWFYLFLAGISEVVWAVGIKYTNGFTKLIPSVLSIVFMLLSVYFLTLASEKIPLSSAYAMWTGIGTMGTVVLSILLFGEVISGFKLLSIFCIVFGVIGLKICS